MVGPSDVESVPSTAEIDAISSRRFSNSFRGWNPDEVRVHLVEVAELVRSLTHRQGELERLLVEAEAAARRADLTRLDPDEVARVLGEETARVLRTARESAAEIEDKARAQAELLARQAADDAARARSDAAREAARVRGEAAEAAAATRAAGEAHLDDVRAAGEADLVEQRERLEAELAVERQQVRDEAAALLTDAQDAAAELRRGAEDEAEQVRAAASEYASAQRASVEAELAQRRAVTEQEITILTERAAAQVTEAETMRERVLADLARKRRAARRHLEQLHAARDRLLTAYEVIRVTTDQATDELSVVLGDAKRASDDAARRVDGEPLPSPEEMLAELDLARMADLPIIAPGDPDRPDAGSSTDDAETGARADEPVDAVTEDAVTEDAVTEDAVTETGEIGPEGGSTAVAGTDSEKVDGSGSAAPTGDHGDGAEVSVDEAGSPTGADPDESSVAPAGRNNHRRHGRRTKHRHDPLGGEALPDVPMTPVDASAEFESVRVVAVEPGETPQSAVAGTDPVEATAAADASSHDAEVADPKPAPASATAGATSADASTVGGGPDSEAPAAIVAPGLPTRATGSTPAATVVASPPAKTESPAADPASDIFARLRAERAPELAADEPGQGASPDATSVDEALPAKKPATAKKPAAAKKSAAEEQPTDKSTAKKTDTPPTQQPAPVERPASKPVASTPAKTAPTAPTKPVARPVTPAKPPETRRPTKKSAAKSARPIAGPTTGTEDPSRLAALFERRDAAVDEVARRLAKHLKRALSDQQSELLDELRRHRGVPAADEVLGSPEEFASGWEAVIRSDLAGASAAGVALAGDLRPDASDHVDVDLSEPAAALVASIAEPLRARLVRALGEGVGQDDDEPVDVDALELADRIRACYREWRGARLAASVADACAQAFGLGVRGAIPESVGLRWNCGPADGPCSDCNDNQLAGVVPAGSVFPTGQQVAPAHPGCRCLALPEPA